MKKTIIKFILSVAVVVLLLTISDKIYKHLTAGLDPILTKLLLYILLPASACIALHVFTASNTNHR